MQNENQHNKETLPRDARQVLSSYEVMGIEKQKHRRHMEIIRPWDLCIYSSCSRESEVTRCFAEGGFAV